MAKKQRIIEVKLKDFNNKEVQKAILEALRKYYGRAEK